MPQTDPHSLPPSNPGDPHATPKQREAAKSEHKRAEDIAYVLNHTGTCLFYDLTGLPAMASALVSNRWNYHVSGNPMPPRRSFGEWGKGLLKEGKEWWLAEVVGDLGAVPLTILTQRYAPGFIDRLGRGAEKVVGPAYRWGAHHSTVRWADEHAVAKDSAEFKAHENAVYHTDAAHLGDAILWTALAFPLNVTVQILRDPEKKIGGIVSGKLGGALYATTSVLAARAMFPAAAQRLDEKTSDHLILPVTRRVGHWLGVDKSTIDAAAKVPDHRDVQVGAHERLRAAPNGMVQNA